MHKPLYRSCACAVRAAVAGSGRVAEVTVNVLIAAAFGVRGSERKTAFVCGRAGDLPAANDVVQELAAVACERLAFTEGQLIDAAENEELVSVCVARTFFDGGIDREVIRAVVDGARPRIVSKQLEAMCETLLHRGL